MPTYLTPGVYVEEVPSANKPIGGVSTSIAAFVGLGPGGPVNTPVRMSNWTPFAKIYGAPPGPPAAWSGRGECRCRGGRGAETQAERRAPPVRGARVRDAHGVGRREIG